MKILVACEYSGMVGDLFHEQGHQVTICDKIPYEGKYPEIFHQGDVVPLLKEPWDLIIAFPPCTDLCGSGAKWWAMKQRNGSQARAIRFFMKFARARCKRIAIENPIGIMSSAWKPPTQIIQPWQFGDPKMKATCLWLKNLPPLIPWIDEKPEGVVSEAHSMADSLSRGKKRSKTYPGVARAMVATWGAI